VGRGREIGSRRVKELLLIPQTEGSLSWERGREKGKGSLLFGLTPRKGGGEEEGRHPTEKEELES